jgi:hypothetical protein
MHRASSWEKLPLRSVVGSIFGTFSRHIKDLTSLCTKVPFQIFLHYLLDVPGSVGIVFPALLKELT